MNLKKGIGEGGCEEGGGVSVSPTSLSGNMLDFYAASALPRSAAVSSYVHSISHRMNRVKQNHGKQILRISHAKFHLPIIQFAAIPHGKRHLSSLPCLGGAAVQIS